MSTWDIQPSEVSGVLNSVAGHIGEEGGSEGLAGSMNAIEDRITAISEAADSAPVSVALSEFAQHRFGLMGGMVGLTISAVEGAGEPPERPPCGMHEEEGGTWYIARYRIERPGSFSVDFDYETEPGFEIEIDARTYHDANYFPRAFGNIPDWHKAKLLEAHELIQREENG